VRLQFKPKKVAVCIDLAEKEGKTLSVKRPKQLSLLKDPRKNTKLWWIVKQTTYGGSLNYRKVKRPFDSKKLTHTVLKARLGKANGFLGRQELVRDVLQMASHRYGVRINDSAIHNDHIHTLTFTKSRDSHIQFLRFVTAELGRRFKALKNHLGQSPRSLWAGRPFTRLVSWGTKSLQRIKKYIERNRHEALGFIPYQPRKHRLTRFLQLWEKQTFSSA
jgi:REP element-mobilizing transposase RayT